MTAQTMIDPLAAFLARALEGQTPSPLRAVEIEARIVSGLALVAVTRRFANIEPQPIEAALTFPTPVSAAVYDLTAEIGGRIFRAQAQRRGQARETYEEALEQGRAAVLHEELLKGVHMLSVGALQPGQEVAVTARWAQPLTVLPGGDATLRLPMSVGEVYGRSGLADSDALVGDGPALSARLRVQCGGASVRRAGGEVSDETELADGDVVAAPLDRPIDLRIQGWRAGQVRSRAADGRIATVSMRPVQSDDRALDVVILVDRSGSMKTPVAGDGARLSGRQAAVAALAALADRLTSADKVDLWQFDNHAERVEDPEPNPPSASLGESGRTLPGAALRRRLAALGDPRGGTEIGRAVATVVKATAPDGAAGPDLLLVTDGKSYALDVQAVARMGRRISALLIGEDSLDAKIGHLAALSGGEIFVATGADLSEAMLAAAESLRSDAAPRPRIDGPPEQLMRRAAGLTLAADWRVDPPAGDASERPRADEIAVDAAAGRAVAAYAASLALGAMGDAEAAALAESEGLVTHLTSLVLVEEGADAADQTGARLPAFRKIGAPQPRLTSSHALTSAASITYSEHIDCAPPERPSPGDTAAGRVVFDRRAPDPGDQVHKRLVDLELWPAPENALADRIDWTARPDLLRKGDVSALAPEIAAELLRLANDPEMRALAARLTVSPVTLVLALLVRRARTRPAAAIVFSRRVLQGAAPALVDDLARRLSA